MSKETAMALMMKASQETKTATSETPPETQDSPENVTAPEAAAAATAKPEAPSLDASKLAIFAKKEAAIVKEREEMKREREAFLKEKEEAERYRTRGKQFDELWAKDKQAALRMLGLSDTDVINILASQEEPKEESPEEKARKIAQEEAQKIRDELKAEKERLEAEAGEAAVKQLKSDIASGIKANLEKYEYCAFEGAEAELQAYEIIAENLRENGTLLTVDEALEICEEYYESRDKAMAQLKKRQPKVEPKAPTAAVTAPAQPAQPAQAAPKAPAITNNLTATSTGQAIRRTETRAEKRERLIKQLTQGTAQ